MLPKITVPRLLIVVGFAVACTYAYDLLPSPVRVLTVCVAIGGGSLMLQQWTRLDGRGDEAGREDSAAGGEDFPDGGGRHVWRVRWWVRLVAVAVPLVGIPFVLEPRLLNPEWENGLPATESVLVVLVYVVLGLAAWAAFHSHLDVDDNFIRVVNPWKTHSFPRGKVTGARSGPRGLELLLDDGRVIVAFAVQCVGVPGSGYRARWVEVARTITGRDPVR